MNFNQIKLLTYAFFVTNKYGIRLGKISDPMEKKKVRLEYSQKILAKLNIKIHVENAEKLPQDGQYLILSNHRSIIDPLIIDIALQNTKTFGLWISKKELYNSLFFGNAVRNGGAIRLDREGKDMSSLFSDIKNGLEEGSSICIFPEGTRNKTELDLLEFKNGSRIIALKNKIPILPVYIETNSNVALKNGLLDNDKEQEVTICIGNLINYKDKRDTETTYRDMFGL